MRILEIYAKYTIAYILFFAQCKRTHLDRCTNEKVLPPALLSVQGSVGSHKKENRLTLHEILPLQTGYELIYGTGYELSIRIPDFWYWPAHAH